MARQGLGGSGVGGSSLRSSDPYGMIRRANDSKKLRVVLGDLDEARSGMRSSRSPRRGEISEGSSLYEGTPSLGIGVQETGEGLLIRAVESDGIASRLDLRPGDLLREINGQKIREVADVRRADDPQKPVGLSRHIRRRRRGCRGLRVGTPEGLDW
mgnify:CR=1 FL=1